MASEESNVSAWVSQYPEHSTLIRRNSHVYGRFAPPNEKESNAWTALIAAFHESESQTGDSS